MPSFLYLMDTGVYYVHIVSVTFAILFIATPSAAAIFSDVHWNTAIKLSHYEGYKSVSILSYVVPEDSIGADFTFQVKTSGAACTFQSVHVYFQYGSYPLIDLYNETYPAHFYTERTDAHHVEVHKDTDITTYSVTRPRAGTWYFTAFLPKEGEKNYKIQQKGLDKKCLYGMYVIFQARGVDNIEEILTDQTHSVHLRRDHLHTQKLYRYRLPRETVSYTVTVDNCVMPTVLSDTVDSHTDNNTDSGNSTAQTDNNSSSNTSTADQSSSSSSSSTPSSASSPSLSSVRSLSNNTEENTTDSSNTDTTATRFTPTSNTPESNSSTEHSTHSSNTDTTATPTTSKPASSCPVVMYIQQEKLPMDGETDKVVCTGRSSCEQTVLSPVLDKWIYIDIALDPNFTVPELTLDLRFDIQTSVLGSNMKMAVVYSNKDGYIKYIGAETFVNIIADKCEEELLDISAWEEAGVPNTIERIVLPNLPAPVSKLNAKDMQHIIPNVMRNLRGGGYVKWGKEDHKPAWWPEDVVFANVKQRPQQQKSGCESLKLLRPESIHYMTAGMNNTDLHPVSVLPQGDCIVMDPLGRFAFSERAFNVTFLLVDNGPMPLPMPLYRLHIPDYTVLVTSLQIQQPLDTGGTLRVYLDAREHALPQGDTRYAMVYVCMMKDAVPGGANAWSCAGGVSLAVNTSTGQLDNMVYMPYPEAATYYLGFTAQCFYKDSHQQVKCHSYPLVNIEVGLSSCVDDSCGEYGACRHYVSGVYLYSTCVCIADWQGFGCTDGRYARSRAEELTSVLLLTLTNLCFGPAVVMAIYRRYHVEAWVYLFTMFFSGFYHACDASNLVYYCMFDYDVLSFADFVGSITSFWVTLLAMARIPTRLRWFGHMLGVMGVAVGTEYDRHGIWTFAIPAGLGILIMFISWVVQCKKRCAVYPPRRYFLLQFLPGVLLAATGLVLFSFFETENNYKYTHSAWHVCMSTCVVFLLPPREVDKKKDNAINKLEDGESPNTNDSERGRSESIDLLVN